MINNNYILNGKSYALGGLIHGEIDGLILSKDGETDIYDIYLDNQTVISLSEKYGLLIGRVHAVSAKEIIAGDGVLLVNGAMATVLKISKRRGISINIPRDVFSLNNVLISKNHIPRTPWTSKKTLDDSTPVNLEVIKK